MGVGTEICGRAGGPASGAVQGECRGAGAETDELLKSQAGTIAGYARAVDFAELDEADEEGFQQALSLVLEQTRDATVAVLVDETGRAVTTPVGDTSTCGSCPQWSER